MNLENPLLDLEPGPLEVRKDGHAGALIEAPFRAHISPSSFIATKAPKKGNVPLKKRP